LNAVIAPLHAGVTERCLADLFAAIASPAGRTRALAVCVSLYEVYCARAFDLLNARAPLAIREDEARCMQVVGLTEHATR